MAAASVRAQGAYHYATVYYINLTDAKGKSVNNDYDANCITAYVGDVPRGTSNRWTVDASTGKTVFAVRVGGKEGDVDKVTFHVTLGHLEYVLDGELPFHGGSDEQYNMPSQPVNMTFIPIQGLTLSPSVIAVKRGQTVAVRTQLQPENHNALYVEDDYIFPVFEFRSSDNGVFTVSDDGVVKGVATGEARLDVTYNYKIRGDVDSYYTYPVASTFASVNVVTDDIPVTGIRNDMHTLQIEREIGEDFQLNFTVLPEQATNRKVTYEVGDENILQCKVDEKNVATLRGLDTGRTTLTITSVDNNEAKLTYQISIVYTNMAGHVTGIVPQFDEIDVLEGDEVTSLLRYTVYPDYAVDKRVMFSVVDDNDVLLKLGSGDIEAVAPGQAEVEIVSVESPTVRASVRINVIKKREANRFTLPDEMTLSKTLETMLKLNMEPADATCDPEKLVFTFEQSKNTGWGAVATATASGTTGRNWLLQGRYVGDYTCTATYDGQAVKTKSGRSQMTIHIPADYVMHDGWHWLSLYAVPASGQLPLKEGSTWVNTLAAGDYSRVYEIRTQEQFMHYDFLLGYFGTLTALRPSDGCFKVNVECEDVDEGKLFLTAGSQNLLTGSGIKLPQTSSGYTWMTYPHELDHSLETLAPYLSQTASEGDMIVGRDDFIEFTNGAWSGVADFTFHAGEGYIYYTEDTAPKTVNWGPAGLAPEPASARPLSQKRRAAISRRHPDTMSMVVSLDDLGPSGDDYAVEACVDGERRALSTVSSDGLLHLSVAGRLGENVTFRLLNKLTGECTPLAAVAGTGETAALPFTTRAGSHSAPVELGVPSVAVIQQHAGQAYDLQGRRVNVNVNVNGNVNKGVYIVNGKKYIK